jgi:hypothetical protein
MLYKIRRTRGTSIEPKPVRQDAAPPQDKRIDSVLSELKSLREELSKSKKHKQEIESLKLQLAELQKAPEKVPEPEPEQEIEKKDIPRTEYKQELKRAQASTPIKYLLHRLDQLDDANNDDECEVSNGQFFSDYCEFCDRNKLKAVSAIAFSKLTKDHVNKRLSHGIRYNSYSRLSLKESLSAYL